MRMDVDPALQGPIPRLEDIAVQITGQIPEAEPDIIPGLLPKHGQLVLAGETNVGKTLVALEVCSALTTGDPLWGSETLVPLNTAKRIIYVLGEHYNEVIQRLWQKTRLPMSDNVWLLGPDRLGADKWLVTGGKPNMVATDKLSRWADGSDLVVFDPLAAFVTGGDGVENDNNAMRTVLDQMSLVSQRTGAACLILGHQGKPQQDAKTGREMARKKYAIRGASAIEDAATNIFYMSKETPAAGQEMIVLTKRKYKGDAPNEYRLARDPYTLCHTLLGNRPFSELDRLRIESMCNRIRQEFPDMKTGDVNRIVGAINNISDRTVQRATTGK